MSEHGRLHSFYKNSPRLRQFWRRTKDDVTYGLARFGLRLVRLFPLPVTLRIAEGLGGLFYALFPEVRRLSHEHLTLAFGDTLTPAERDRIARGGMINAMKCFCEVAKFPTMVARIDDYIEMKDKEIVDALLHQGQGAIVVTGHLGNWELLAAYFGLKGIDISAVARRMHDERINDLLVEFRKQHGVQTILRESPSSARDILKALNRGAALAMVIDQDTQAQSVTVPFFGAPARTPAAPATLAVRRKVPLVAAFIERLADGRHRITVHPPLELPNTGDRIEDTRRIMAACNSIVEAEIRQRPDQWVWWHRRWRRRPIEHLDLDANFQYQTSPEVSEGA